MSAPYGKVNNILIIAITRLGDLLQASPTIMGLKEENPGARITVLVDRSFRDICEGIPCIDEIYEIDLSMIVRCLVRENDGIVDAYRNLTEHVEILRARNFDYCLNMSSSSYTALLLKMLNIKESRGWTSDDEGKRLISNPWSMLFGAFIFHNNREYNSINLVDIVRCSAGVRLHSNRLVYQVAEEDKLFPTEFLQKKSLAGNGPLVCLQAGASQAKRQWAPECFAQVIKTLVEEEDARVVLTGSRSEIPIIEAVRALYQHENVVTAGGETNLSQLAALLETADVLVTGDTGPMHLSIAVATPVVALFLASAYCFETGPYSEGNIVIQPQITCNPCNPNFTCSRPDCHAQITPELVAFLTQARLHTTVGEEADICLPDHLVNPADTAVYYTTFDKDNFLEFKPMYPVAGRNGYHGAFYDAARAAYRELWRQEFGAVDPRPMPVADSARMGSVLQVLDPRMETLNGINEAANLSGNGVNLIEELTELIKDENSSVKRLAEINEELSGINREIEEVGLTYPVLGAMVRMFVMERQNMRGQDPLVLASEMKELFQTLSSRGEKFSRLFTHAASSC